MPVAFSHKLTLLLFKRDSKRRQLCDSPQLLSLLKTKSSNLGYRATRRKNEEFYTVIPVLCDSAYHRNTHCFCWRRVVTEKSHGILFRDYPHSTQTMKVYANGESHEKSTILYSHSCYLGLDLSHAVSFSVLKGDSNWREATEYLQLLSNFNTDNETSCARSNRI